jgi:signal transduction histidine kinase/CheY-like chemotaxis protein
VEIDRDLQTVLVLAPVDSDGPEAVQVLKDGGIHAIECKDLSELVGFLERNFGAILITEEALSHDRMPAFQEVLLRQESWSDIPVILLSNQRSIWAAELISGSCNITILERPTSRFTMLRALQVALRARRRQYQVRDILQAQAQATQKRDEFFATLSHELRTPLNVILGWLEILLSEQLDRKAQKSALEILDRNARIQKGLIDDLLDVSRIISNKLFLEPVPFSLADLVRSTVTGFFPRAAAKNIALKMEIPDLEFPFLGDEDRIGQVVSNLLSNSIKFTPVGGEISITLIVNGSTYVLEVKDSGHGIEPSFLPHIFDRLKQEDMSTTRVHGGLGLGLAISAHIVKEHQGTIVASSEGRGKGATLKVCLPALQSFEISMKSEKSLFPTRSLEGIKILVVDDSPDILELIELWLAAERAEVRHASSAAEALKVFPEFKPKILLSDIGMPEMDGYQLINAVRKLPVEAGGHVLAGALTAYARDEEKSRALKAGFQIHISKPISNSDLIGAISALLQLGR